MIDADTLAAVVREAIGKAVDPLHERIAALQTECAVLKARIDDRPVPKDGAAGRDGKDAPAIDEEALFRRLKMELPGLIPAPIPGKDAPAVDTESLFVRLKAELPALIPAPIRGEKGDKGDPGKDGRDGTDGRDGAPGAVGEKGAAGERGEKGEPGTNGRDGKDGSSVDPLIVRALVLEEVQKAVKELPLPKDGKDGRDGRDGKDGSPGSAGRDAAAIEFVTLDAAKSYPRGTFALHKAGIWHAERATEGMDGWRLVASGICGAKATLLSDGRTFEFTFERSDGSTETSRAKAAIPDHKGVWRDGVAYEKGDQVQHAGSLWTAQGVTTEKPGDSKDWVLSARRGRDGKDA